MSIRTVNSMLRWRDGYTINDLRTFFVQLANGYTTDAPAFYGSVTVRRWGSGARSKALTGPARTVTESYDYDESVTFIRIAANASVNSGGRFQSPVGLIDYFSASSPPASDTDCLILMGDASSRSLPDFGKHHLRLHYYKLIDPVTVGTLATNFDDSGTPDTSEDIVSFIEFTPPEWGYSTPPTDYGQLYDQWMIIAGAAIGTDTQVDLGCTPSRDIRGTYTASFNDADIDGSWDTNSVVHHVSLTLS